MPNAIFDVLLNSAIDIGEWQLIYLGDVITVAYSMTDPLDIQGQMEMFAGIEPGDCLVTAITGGYRFEFTGNLANTHIPNNPATGFGVASGTAGETLAPPDLTIVSAGLADVLGDVTATGNWTDGTDPSTATVVEYDESFSGFTFDKWQADSSSPAVHSGGTAMYCGGYHTPSGLAPPKEAYVSVSMPADGEVTFWWKSTILDGYGSLQFLIDGVVQDTLINTDWEQVTFPLTAGTRQLTWRLNGDLDNNDAVDYGVVDEIKVTYDVAGTAATFTVTTNFQPSQGTLTLSNLIGEDQYVDWDETLTGTTTGFDKTYTRSGSFAMGGLTYTATEVGPSSYPLGVSSNTLKYLTISGSPAELEISAIDPAADNGAFKVTDGSSPSVDISFDATATFIKSVLNNNYDLGADPTVTGDVGGPFSITKDGNGTQTLTSIIQGNTQLRHLLEIEISVVQQGGTTGTRPQNGLNIGIGFHT